jgi:hypothetical protein
MSSPLIVTKAPCAKCPFRKDVPIYLHQERRAEIADALINQRDFHCHATVDYDTGVEDEEGFDVPSTAGASLCAGAMTALALSGGSNQSMRIAARLGLIESETGEESDNVWSLTEWVKLAEGATADDYVEEDEEGETCSIVDAGCEAPAGYMGSGGGIVEGTVYVDTHCYGCGDPVCDSCLATYDPEPLCPYCAEVEDEDE